MKPGIVADEMFPEGTNTIMDMEDEVYLLSKKFILKFYYTVIVCYCS